MSRTHIKCTVNWNAAEKTWDCLRHGSRFSFTGEMLTAPARKDLEVLQVEELEKYSFGNKIVFKSLSTMIHPTASKRRGSAYV